MGERLDSVFQLFHRLLGSPAAPCTDDVELVDSFLRRRDEKAFEELVRRHGPMVLGTCRRVLRDPHAAEDAFQVTFLTLACKAASLRRGQALAAWLHRVAFRLALRIRSRGRRTADIEREALPMSRPDHETEAGWRELPAVLDEELQRLPEILRGPLVLCGLEGKTHEEAARELGWPTGSLSKRLARGRDLLRQRLARRGFALGAAAGLVAEATAAVPEPLLGTTIQRAVAVAAGRTAELPAATAALLREALRTMFWTPLKVMVLALAILATPAAGLGLFTLLHAEQPPAPRPEKPARKEARPPHEEPAGFGKLIVALGPKKFRFRSVFLGVAASPDGKLFAVSDAHVVHLYDAASKKELRTWQGLEGYSVRSMAFSPDGKVLATADGSKDLRLWDVATGKLTRTFNTHSSAHSVVFSPDGKLLAVANESGQPQNKIWIDLWEVATWKKVATLEGHTQRVLALAFSADGKVLVSGSQDTSARVWDLRGTPRP